MVIDALVPILRHGGLWHCRTGARGGTSRRGIIRGSLRPTLSSAPVLRPNAVLLCTLKFTSTECPSWSAISLGRTPGVPKVFQKSI
jgi:hypothetical protein